GKFLAHSDLNQLFKTYNPPPGMLTKHAPGIQTFRVKDPSGMVTDYVSAVFYHGQWLGEVHAGVGDGALQKVSDQVKLGVLKLMALIALGLAVGIYAVFRIFIKPFQKIL